MRQRIAMAWDTARMYRMKQFPELAAEMPAPLEVLRGERPEKTPEQEWAIWTAIAAQANAIDAQRKAQGLDN